MINPAELDMLTALETRAAQVTIDLSVESGKQILTGLNVTTDDVPAAREGAPIPATSMHENTAEFVQDESTDHARAFIHCGLGHERSPIKDRRHDVHRETVRNGPHPSLKSMLAAQASRSY
jgi:predicted protein tyrosine phosphatase